MNPLARIYDRVRHAVRYFLLRKLPACEVMVPVMSESLERPLTIRERILVKVHLAICVWCVWYLDHLHVIRKASRQRGANGADDTTGSPPGMPSDVRERIRRALEERK